MRNFFRKLAYSKNITFILRGFFSLFYEKKFLQGKFFDTYRIGYLWCLLSMPRIFSLRRSHIYFPCGRNTTILGGENISFDPDSINVFQQAGCYYQGFGRIQIGKDCWIANNVGIITANHNKKNPEEHDSPKSVILGDRCWIGMNSVLLPGVTLGDNTVVGAGSIVTKSFPEGNAVIAGNPAKIIKRV